MKFFLFVFLCVFISRGECKSSKLPKEECYKIDKVMHDPTMKNTEICRFLSNFCTFTSPVSFNDNEDNIILYSRPIPCSQFERFKKIACLSK
jgi:hypothetical protein